MVTGPFVAFPITPSAEGETEGDFHSAKGSRPTKAKMVALFMRIAANADELGKLNALPKVAKFSYVCTEMRQSLAKSCEAALQSD